MATKRALLNGTARIATRWWASRLHNPVFVVGCARSGTTILTEWLNSHHDIANLSEANDIWDPLGFPWAKSPNGKNSPPIWIDPQAHRLRWWHDNKSRREDVRAIFSVYQTVKRAKVFVNKSPLNTFRIPYLLEMFPDARFVHIVRDGRAVAHSYAKKQHSDMSHNIEMYRRLGYDFTFDELTLKLADYWRLAVEEVAKQDREFNLTDTERLLEIRYETLCTNTNHVLESLCRFIGIDQRRFRPQITPRKMESQNYKWRNELSRELITGIQLIQDKSLRYFGYI